MKYGDELLELTDEVKDSWAKSRLIEDYFSSFIWRSSYVTYDKFFGFIKKYPVKRNLVWEVFIENAVKEQSELNAIGLTKLLNRYTMNRRDLLWTTVINGFDEDNRIISLANYIEAGNALNGFSDNKAYLLVVTFTWMLSSSNRILRDRVSKAMIEILREHFQICEQVLVLFKDVNDPYILQRLYGVVFGSVMKRRNDEKSSFKALAWWVYKEIFDKDMVYPDILLRDYARLIVERFATEYPDDLGEIQLRKVVPPYKSEPIPIVPEADYGSDAYMSSGLSPLLYSMKFDMNVKGVGFYGDFGRYVFQSALSTFVNLDIANIYYYALKYILDDLGYNPKWFAEYDKNRCYYDRHDVKRVERIGKKYQWIAMYNILARVADTHNIKGGDWNDKMGTVYEGPWNPYVRDFDPTLNMKIQAKDAIPHMLVPQYGEESFCDINSSENDVEKWLLEDDRMFQDFPGRFINMDEHGKEWVSLCVYQKNELRLEREEHSAFSFSKGEQCVWSIATMYILPSVGIKCAEQDLIDRCFIRYNSNGMHTCYSLFSREYAWSPGYNAAFRGVEEESEVSGLKTFSAAVKFLWEEEYDASHEETISFAIPAGQIIQEMQLYQKDADGVFYRNEEIVAFDLTLTGSEKAEAVIRKDVLDEYISKTGVQIFWTVAGEKQFFSGSMKQKWHKREGYFIYKNGSIVGSIRLVSDNC